MADLVMDANYLVASLLTRRRRHSKAKDYWDRMEAGEHYFHLPILVLVEVASAFRDEIPSEAEAAALFLKFKTALEQVEVLGRVSIYDLDHDRALLAAQLALRHEDLSAGDAVYAALAEEKQARLKTLDLQLRKAYPGAEP